MDENKQIMVIEPGSIQSVNAVKAQLDAVNNLYKTVMQKNLHFGVIPGTGNKDTLLKPGAEKILIMFQLVAKIDSENIIDIPGGHRECRHIIGVYHKQSLTLWGQGTGSCSTMESKYRYRNAKLVCPECKQEAIIKGKEEFGGGWICWKKQGGCGQKFSTGFSDITNQNVGKVENPDLADQYNTVQKMSYKRALVAAVISATGISDIFNQDLEESHSNGQAEKIVDGVIAAKKDKGIFDDIPKDTPKDMPEKDINGMSIEDVLQDYDNCSTMDDFLALNNDISNKKFSPDESDQINKKKIQTNKRLKEK